MSLHSILHVKLLRNVAIHRQRQEKILFWRSDNAPKKRRFLRILGMHRTMQQRKEKQNTWKQKNNERWKSESGRWFDKIGPRVKTAFGIACRILFYF